MKREKPHRTQVMTCTRIQPDDWAMMKQEAPQKIFVWDMQGNYQDYAFPNPIYGHFLGGMEVKGKNIREVLEPQAVALLLEAMQYTTTRVKPVRVNLMLFGSQSAYQSVVCLFPFSEHIMGWINDYPIAEAPYLPMHVNSGTPANRQNKNNTLSICTSREREVCVFLCEGKTNTEIAYQLQLSERAVRFHLENLFRKYRVSSRLQLVQYVSDLLLSK